MKTLKLDKVKGLLKRIAAAKISADGVYYCLIAGEKIRIIK